MSIRIRITITKSISEYKRNFNGALEALILTFVLGKGKGCKGLEPLLVTRLLLTSILLLLLGKGISCKALEPIASMGMNRFARI